jgi:hypothetical protein
VRSLPVLLAIAEAHRKLAAGPDAAAEGHRRSAVLSYGEILRSTEVNAFDHPQAAIPDLDIYQMVVEPGLAVAQGLADPPATSENQLLRQSLADLWGMKGLLVARDSDVEDRVLRTEEVLRSGEKDLDQVVYQAFQKANRLQERVEFLVGEGEACLKLKDLPSSQKLAEVTRLAQKVMENYRQHYGGYGLMGHALVRKARSLPDLSKKKEEYKNAQDKYTTALDLVKQHEQKTGSQVAAARVSYLVGRSVGLLDWAFLVKDSDPAEAKKHLDQALQDATDAEALANAYSHPEYIYNAKGNALEDKGYYLNELEFYPHALEAFYVARDKAQEQGRSPGLALMNLGRCQYRYAMFAQVDRATKSQVLAAARESLIKAELELRDTSHEAETHSWLSLVYLELAGVAEQALRDANQKQATASIEEAIRLTSREDHPSAWLQYHEAALLIAFKLNDGAKLKELFDALLADEAEPLISPERLVVYLDAYYAAPPFIKPADKIAMLKHAIEQAPSDAASLPYRAKLHLLTTWVVLGQKDTLWKTYSDLATRYAEEAYALSGKIQGGENLPPLFQRNTLRAEACVHSGYIAYGNGVVYADGTPTKAGDHKAAEPWFIRSFERLKEAIQLQPAIELSHKSRLVTADCAWRIYQGRQIRRITGANNDPALKEALDLLRPVVDDRTIDTKTREAAKRLWDNIDRVVPKLSQIGD